MSSAIRIERLTKKFRRVEALKGLNLDIPEGAIYALVGPTKEATHMSRDIKYIGMDVHKGKLIRADVYLSPKGKNAILRTTLLEFEVNHPESGAQPTPHAASIF